MRRKNRNWATAVGYEKHVNSSAFPTRSSWRSSSSSLFQQRSELPKPCTNTTRRRPSMGGAVYRADSQFAIQQCMELEGDDGRVPGASGGRDQANSEALVS